MEAQYHCNKKVLLLLGQHHHLIDQPEFMAEENVLLPNKKDTLASEGATVNNETIKASTLTTTQPMSKESTATQVGPLTFDLSLQLEDDEQHVHVASDEQAELMRWHYCLGHLAFSKLKQLALNNKIPKQLAKIKPPVCAGCLFGAMTMVLWRGKEGSYEHTVFTATKPGMIVSVDQLISTQVGFIAQLKGRLTK